MFVLTCLMMASVLAETCSTNVKTQSELKQTFVMFDRVSVVYLTIYAMA
jgi:hypothetical protein